MPDKQGSEAAFPGETEGQTGPSTWRFPGLTKREYFAAKAISALTEASIRDGSWDPSAIAYDAVSVADALLAALKEKGDKGHE